MCNSMNAGQRAVSITIGKDEALTVAIVNG